MQPEILIDRLAAGAATVSALVSGIPAARSAQRSDPQRWSILEILCHLRDEEREDFRPRIEYTLQRPGTSWPGIDPEAWVSERAYAAADPTAVLAEFRAARDKSLRWLRALEQPDWDAAYEHPLLGRLTAGDLLASWAAHDMLHLRQLTGEVFALSGQAAAPHRTDYAGRW